MGRKKHSTVDRNLAPGVRLIAADYPEYEIALGRAFAKYRRGMHYLRCAFSGHPAVQSVVPDGFSPRSPRSADIDLLWMRRLKVMSKVSRNTVDSERRLDASPHRAKIYDAITSHLRCAESWIEAAYTFANADGEGVSGAINFVVVCEARTRAHEYMATALLEYAQVLHLQEQNGSIVSCAGGILLPFSINEAAQFLLFPNVGEKPSVETR